MNTLQIVPYALLVAVGALTASGEPGTAFTYQGRLSGAGGPLDGSYDFVFALYDDLGQQVGDSLTNLAVAATEGRFGVVLDFGPNSFRKVLVPLREWVGPGEWLEISVRTNRGKTYQLLTPRQRITPAPYASTLTGTLPSSAIEGVYSGSVNFGNPANVFAGRYYGDGSNLTNLNLNLSGGNGWNLAGNAGTTPGTQFLGTTDNQALELRVNGKRALRLEPTVATPNLVGGFVSNRVGGGAFGAVVAGGGTTAQINQVMASYSAVGGGSGNSVESPWAIVSGGLRNRIREASGGASIGGGTDNFIAADGDYGVIGGGEGNTVSDKRAVVGGGWGNTNRADAATIAGGRNNFIMSGASYANIAGGVGNGIAMNVLSGTIGGGHQNAISTESASATIAGGEGNLLGINSDYSVIGGGYSNTVALDASAAVIGGGGRNTVGAANGTVGGGSGNQARGLYATVPGGRQNDAAGDYSFAAGRRAQALGSGSFVWADGGNLDYFTAGPEHTNVFFVRARGGARFHTGTNAFWTEGDLSCATLTIRGGADLAEPFAMSDELVPPGAVVVIDPDRPGRLKVSRSAYDHKVAGIVSGAGGVQPGISMIQTEALEGGRNVALSGRVYALVDATEHPVRPGDLLTTSAIPGHAMKSVNPALAQGAILGKAMTPLTGGRGLVLVLVSLQ